MPYDRKFTDTLYNEAWVKARTHLNASELAREADCSVPAAISAFKRFGLPSPSISEAKAGRAAPYKHKKEGEKICRTTSSRRAHAACPPGPCAACGEPNASDVNHINRDWQNNTPENLERLCPTCHKRQYSAENELMYLEIVEFGRNSDAFRRIHAEARERLLAKDAGTFKFLPEGLVEFRGERKTIGAWALHLGVNEGTLRSRITNLGWTVEEAFTTPLKGSPVKFDFDGVSDTFHGHALRHGIDPGVAYSRKRAGWDIERILKTPIK